MAIKNNLKQIQEDFKGDEKILENAFRLERFFKKYKYVFLIIVIALIIWGVYAEISSYMNEKKAQETTRIYNELLKSPQNQVLLDELKSSSKELYELFLYAQATKNGDEDTLKSISQTSSNFIIKTLSVYQYASYSQNFNELQKNNSNGMKDFSLLQEIYLLDKEGKVTEAKALIPNITNPSIIYGIASILGHYGITKTSNENLVVEHEKTEAKRENKK